MKSLFVSGNDAPPPSRPPPPHITTTSSSSSSASSSSSYFTAQPGRKRRSTSAAARPGERQRTGRKGTHVNTGRGRSGQNGSQGGKYHGLAGGVSDEDEWDDSDDDDSDADSSGDMLCAMAAFFDGHDLGVASFNDDRNVLSVGWAACPNKAVLGRQLLLFAETTHPAFVLVSSSASALLVNECKALFSKEHPGSVLSGGTDVPVGASQTFTSSQANVLLEELCGSASNGAIANAALCAAGGLLTFLLRRQVIFPPTPADSSASGLSTSRDGTSYRPSIHLRVSHAAKSVLIDKMSLDALGVFNRDRHPNVHGTQTHKEGYSLAKLLCSYARQQGSKKLLRSWLRRPSNDRAVLHYRYNTIEMFLKSTANSEVISSMVTEIHKMKSVKSAITRLQSLAASSLALHEIRDWKNVYEFCAAAKRLRHLARTILQTSNGGIDVATINTAFDRMARIPMPIDEIDHQITGIVNFKISKDCVPQRAFPRRGLDADLDAWRKIDDGLGSFLEKVAQDAAYFDCGPRNIISERFGCAIRVEYRPQVGYTMLLCGAKAPDLPELQEHAESLGMSFVFMQRSDELDYGEDQAGSRHVSHLKTMPRRKFSSNVTAAAGNDDSHTHQGRDDADSNSVFGGGTDEHEERFILHFKTARMIEMDNTIGDVTVQIADAEAKILLQLRRFILDRADALIVASNAIFEFDALAAMAELANEKNYTRPILCEDFLPSHDVASIGSSSSSSNSGHSACDEHVIDMVDGRHPLQEFSVEQFIPNTLKMTANGSIIIITGPNGSGKSVLLRQVGLLTIMAKAGSFVPARSFKVPKIDQIFTRITNQETATSEESAFTIDLHQVHAALNNSTPRSLVLIDEFGKGTVATDGVALLAAAIKTLDAIGPKVILTTHAWELFEHRLLAKCVHVRTFTMEVEADNESDADDGSSGNGSSGSMLRVGKDGAPAYTQRVIPLYSLVPGLASSSMTLACASQNGFEPSVLHRAQHVIDSLRAGTALQAVSDVAEFAPAWAHEHKRNNDARKRLVEFLLTKQPDSHGNQDDVVWSSRDIDKLFECIDRLQNISPGVSVQKLQGEDSTDAHF